MTNAVVEVRDKLRTIRDLCMTETKGLRTQLKEAEKELEQVDAALAAIGEKPSRSKGKKRSSGKSRLPCATKSEVLEVIHQTLAENSQVPKDDLKELAGEKLRERGKSLSMFEALFAKCLSEPSIEELSSGSYALTGVVTDRQVTKSRKVGF